jgi:hypothetical protein
VSGFAQDRYVSVGTTGTGQTTLVGRSDIKIVDWWTQPFSPFALKVKKGQKACERSTKGLDKLVGASGR